MAKKVKEVELNLEEVTEVELNLKEEFVFDEEDEELIPVDLENEEEEELEEEEEALEEEEVLEEDDDLEDLNWDEEDDDWSGEDLGDAAALQEQTPPEELEDPIEEELLTELDQVEAETAEPRIPPSVKNTLEQAIKLLEQVRNSL